LLRCGYVPSMAISSLVFKAACGCYFCNGHVCVKSVLSLHQLPTPTRLVLGGHVAKVEPCAILGDEDIHHT
jgi:hypothetical protein